MGGLTFSQAVAAVGWISFASSFLEAVALTEFHMEGVEGNEEEALNASLVPLLALSCFPELNRIVLMRQKKEAIYLCYMRWLFKGALIRFLSFPNSALGEWVQEMAHFAEEKASIV